MVTLARRRLAVLGATLAIGSAFSASTATAQTMTTPTSSAPLPSASQPPSEPSVAPPAVAAPTAATPPASEHPLTIGLGLRVGFILQDPNDPSTLKEVHFDTGHYSNVAELRLHGDVTEQFAWTANFNAVVDGSAVGTTTIGSSTGSTYAVLGIQDLIAQFKVAPELQIWAGRLLVPSDRTNFSGSFFSSPWNYQGFYLRGAAPVGPMQGPNGRNQGLTVWGNLLEGKLKYYVGAYGLDQGGANSTQAPTASPFYSARVSYALQGTEPGYFGSSTFYGEKSLTSLGVAAQYLPNGAVDPTTGAPKDAVIMMADFLTEQAVAGTGTFTFEGQFYAFPSGYDFGNSYGIFSPREALYALASYLTPHEIGIGKVQAMVRWQQTIDPAWTILDAALAYVVKSYDARVVLTYQHIDTGTTGGAGGGVSNALQLGVQLQK